MDQLASMEFSVYHFSQLSLIKCLALLHFLKNVKDVYTWGNKESDSLTHLLPTGVNCGYMCLIHIPTHSLSFIPGYLKADFHCHMSSSMTALVY